MWKISLLFLLFLPHIFAKDKDLCSIDYSIMYAIQKIERHPRFEVGYPYLISFNSEDDKKRVRKNLNLNWIDSRSVDCQEIVKCEDVLKKILKLNIKNVDLGAFQINYKYHIMETDEYFNNKKSYLKACRMIERLIKKYGMSADSIARYHSSTRKHRVRYANKLFKYYIEEKSIVGSDIYYYDYY